jgi:signal transduction histidine kinase/CheY-like chemotaxis protein
VASRAWILFLAFCVVVAAPYWSVSPIASDWVWAGLGWGAVAAVLIGVRLHKPAVRLPWYLLALCLALFVIGDNLYSYQTDVLHNDAYPSIADVFYLVMYPVGFAGLLLLVRRRSTGRDRSSVIDVAIITTSLGVWSWVLLISPYVHGDAALAPRLVSAAYPLCDIAMLAVAVRLAVGAGRRAPAFFFIVLGIGAMLLADALYGYKALDGTWHEQNIVDLGWILFYASWGVAALHPSMHAITEREEVPTVSGRRRIVVVGAAAIAPSMLELLHPIGHDTTPIAVATIVMFVLVLVRVSWLMRDIAGREIEARFQVDALHAAQEHSRQKSMFLANMSHEIRTPLNGVVGMIDLLRETDLNPQQRDYADMLAGSAVYLAGLVNDILDFSRVEAGKLELEAEPFELRQTVDAAIDVGAARALDKGLELVAIVESDVPTIVVGDHIRVRQVLGNLVSNATKFTNVGRVVVRVTNAVGGIYFEVEDTGVGLPPEGRDRLFEQFVQADQSTTREHGGSGLGWAICKPLVTLRGGEIGVTSARRAGSTFWFRIPLVPVVTDDDDRLRDKRVLVAADDAHIGESLRHLLEHWGAECGVVTSAPRAMEALASRPYDVLIVDDDHRRLAREVRRGKHTAAIPIVALAASPRPRGDSSDVIDAWLTKPVRHTALLECMETLERVEPAPIVPEAEPRSHGGHILVVEDNLVNQKVATALLAQLGYSTDIAQDGVDALTRLENHTYDAILMDCQMPRLDGYEATMEIRRRENGTHIPIIAMTASALFSDRDRCMDVGMDEYLTKPINRDVLAATLAHFLSAAV